MEIQIFTPPIADETKHLDHGLVGLTQAISQIDPDLVAHGFLGGDLGYGARWESDVFMMKPYCWCEKEGECPWCTGCGIYRKDCKACSILHADGCFQSALESGMRTWLAERVSREKYSSEYFSHRDHLAQKLGRERGISRPKANQLLCDCGADDAKKSARETLGCDYHRGAGIFARFAPWQLNHETLYFDPPHFWHKPTNFRVRWYKWIGRDMVTNGVKADLAAILVECIASLPKRPS